MKLGWEQLWNTIFGTDTWMGINMGFWVVMGIIAIAVLIQNIVFWRAFRPFEKYRQRDEKD